MPRERSSLRAWVGTRRAFCSGAIESSEYESARKTISTWQARPTVTREVEQFWHLFSTTSGMPRVGESTIRSTKLVEEWVNHGLDGRETLSRGVLEKSRDQLNRIWGRFAEYLDTELVSGLSFEKEKLIRLVRKRKFQVH